MSARRARTSNDATSLGEAATMFELASSPIRLEILAQLDQGRRPATSKELAAGLPPKDSAIAHHLTLMTAFGLLERSREWQGFVYSIVDNAHTRAILRVVRLVERGRFG